MTVIWCMVPEIWSATDTIFCHFGLCIALIPPTPPYTPNNLKNQNLKKWKNHLDILYIMILHMCTKNDNHMKYGSWISSTIDRIFCHSGPFFALLPRYGPRKTKFLKNEKKPWKYYHFTNVYHKWQSYDVWFLRYGVQQTEFFVILDHLLPFYHHLHPHPRPNNLKNQNLKKWKNHLDILSSYTCVPKMTIIWSMVPEISNTTNRMFCHFGSFFAFFAP